MDPCSSIEHLKHRGLYLTLSKDFKRRSVAQWLRRCTTKLAVMGSILADAIAFTDFVSSSEVLKPDCLFPTHGCAEAFILQWTDTAWNLLFFKAIKQLYSA